VQKKKGNKRIQDQMLDVVAVVDDGDDARRAPQGVILAVLSQFLKAFRTNYILSSIDPHQVTLF